MLLGSVGLARYIKYSQHANLLQILRKSASHVIKGHVLVGNGVGRELSQGKTRNKPSSMCDHSLSQGLVVSRCCCMEGYQCTAFWQISPGSNLLLSKNPYHQENLYLPQDHHKLGATIVCTMGKRVLCITGWEPQVPCLLTSHKQTASHIVLALKFELKAMQNAEEANSRFKHAMALPYLTTA